MERGSAFTALPGWGGVAIGLSAVVAGVLAMSAETPAGWMTIWLVEAAVAGSVGVWTVSQKTRRARMSLLSGPGRKFLLSFAPAVVAGAVLTVALFRTGFVDLLPGTWLLLYGAGVVSAGTFSVEIVPVMGVCFMVVGAVALLGGSAFGDPLMILGFGGFHVVFGTAIARRYGG